MTLRSSTLAMHNVAMVKSFLQ